MKTIRLMTCESPIEANIIKGRLENEGIRCFVTNENFSNLMPHYNRILGSGADLMINKEDYEKAAKILDLNSSKDVVCPNCNSSNIKISLGNNWFKKAIVIVISLFYSVPFNNINSIYLCKDCKTEFKNK